MNTLKIARRFNGPPLSGNGGYVCGSIAKIIGASVRVRLHKPPPLEEEMIVRSVEPDTWHILRDNDIIASAKLAAVDAEVPQAPPYIEALGVSKHFPGFHQHDFPTCFVCGPQRTRGDGLRIFPGSVPGSSTLFAAPWMPDISLADASGKVLPEFIWAALDCPGSFGAVPPGRHSMLGELCVHIDRSVHADEPCVVIGWGIKAEGRKYTAGTALFDEEGERCAVGVATWIELLPRPITA